MIGQDGLVGKGAYCQAESLGLIPGTQIVKKENQFLHADLKPPHVCYGECPPNN